MSGNYYAKDYNVYLHSYMFADGAPLGPGDRSHTGSSEATGAGCSPRKGPALKSATFGVEAGVLEVLVVSSQPVYRAGLAGMLNDDPMLTCVGQATSLEQADTTATSSRPHVVLLDTNRQSLDIETNLLRIRSVQPAPRFVCLLERTGSLIERRVMAAGAYCVLPRDAALLDIRAAVLGDFRGVQLRSMAQNPRGRRLPILLGADLTNREMDVLQLLGCGMSNAEVSTRLGITRPTVKYHVTSVLQKLNASNRTDAVLTALRHGVISLEDVAN